MNHVTRRMFGAGAIGLGLAAVSGGNAMSAEDPVYSRRGLAIRGTDPVAYFLEQQPVEGKAEFEHEWNDATWRFASAGNRDLFIADPEAYAPQYGGYCAYAVSKGYTASIVPEAWTIVDNKLYLNYSLGVRNTWSKDIPGNIIKANANWPGVLK